MGDRLRRALMTVLAWSVLLVARVSSEAKLECFGGLTCSGGGRCGGRHAECSCAAGRTGLDCAEGPGDALFGNATDVVAPGPRPRVHVYDLPGDLVWRDAGDFDFGRPESMWVLLRLLGSPHRVASPERADLHFVPSIGARYTSDREKALHWVQENHKRLWARNKGADHVFIGTDDDGAKAYFKARLSDKAEQAPVFITHAGLVMQQKSYTKGNLGSFVRHHDIVYPPAQPGLRQIAKFSPLLNPRADRPARAPVLFFAGSVEHGLTDHPRTFVWREHRDKPNMAIFDTSTQQLQIQDYFRYYANSTFCLGAPGKGSGWGRRVTIAALMGCIPIVTQEHTALSLGELLPWAKMSVRVHANDMPRLPEIVAELAKDTERIRAMQRELACAWPRWLYSSAVGSLSGEDGSEDAIESVLLIMKRRLEGIHEPVKSACDLKESVSADRTGNRVNCWAFESADPRAGPRRCRHVRGWAGGAPPGGAACAGDKTPELCHPLFSVGEEPGR